MTLRVGFLHSDPEFNVLIVKNSALPGFLYNGMLWCMFFIITKYTTDELTLNDRVRKFLQNISFFWKPFSHQYYDRSKTEVICSRCVMVGQQADIRFLHSLLLPGRVFPSPGRLDQLSSVPPMLVDPQRSSGRMLWILK